MYLTERIIGISTYLAVSILTFGLLYKKGSSSKKILSIYLISTSILAFFYIPPTGEDYYRIIGIMEQMKNGTIIDVFNNIFNTSYPLAYLVYFLCAKTNLYGLVPAIANFITFNNIFYILNKYYKKNNNTRNDIAWMFLLIISTGIFGYLIANIRALTALSFVARCIYNEIIEERNTIKQMLFYAAAFLIHPVSIVLIGSWLIFRLFTKGNKTRHKIMLILVGIITIVIARNMLGLAYKKYVSYAEENTYFYVYDFIKFIIINLPTAYLVNVAKSYAQKHKNKEIIALCKYVVLLQIIIVLLHEYNIFARISYIIPIIALPIYLSILKNINNYKYKRTIIMFIFTMIMIPLVLSITRGHLSSFKYLLF